MAQPPPYQQQYPGSGQPYQQPPGQPYQGGGQPYQQPYQQQPYPQGYQQPPQQGYQQQQPYPGQPYQQQPYQQQGQYPPQNHPHPNYEGQHAGYQQHAQGSVACRVCGSGPAAPATFRAVAGALVMHTMWTTNGPFCRDCGLSTFRRQTTKTLAVGWCSIGAIIIAPIFLLMNLVARGKVADLPAPQPYQAGQAPAPLDPGPPVFARPGAYVYPALGFLLFVFVVIGNLSS